MRGDRAGWERFLATSLCYLQSTPPPFIWTECNATSWGPNCSLTCNNTCPDSNCDHVTGDCICPSGNEGVKCDQSVNPTNGAGEGGGAGVGSIIPIVVGAAGAFVLILLIVAAVFLWRCVFTGDSTRLLKHTISGLGLASL